MKTDLNIVPMQHKYIPGVVDLHLKVLGDTPNAHLGNRFLNILYERVVDSQYGVGFVVVELNEVVGFISGTTDVTILRTQIMRGIPYTLWPSVLWKLISHPRDLYYLLLLNKLNNEIIYEGQPIRAELLTLGVNPETGRHGLGKQLSSALANAFKSLDVKAFHLNTNSSNQKAKSFYTKLGFHFIRVRFGQNVFIGLIDELLNLRD